VIGVALCLHLVAGIQMKTKRATNHSRETKRIFRMEATIRIRPIEVPLSKWLAMSARTGEDYGIGQTRAFPVSGSIITEKKGELARVSDT
jgi:hypothetical protein